MLPGITPSINTRLESTFVGSLDSVATTSIVDLGDFNSPGNGLLVVAISAGYTQARPLASVTIGGVTATLHSTASAGNIHAGAIASRVVGPGTQNLTVNFSSTSAVCHASASAWLLRNYRSTSHFGQDTSTGAAASHNTTFAVPSPSFQAWSFGASFNSVVGLTWSSATTTIATTLGAIAQGQGARQTVTAESSHVETVSLTSIRFFVGASFR